MNKLPLIAFLLLTATHASAADTGNMLSDTPPPAAPALVMPPPLVATPAPAATAAPALALPAVTPAPAATATPAATPAKPATTTAPKPHKTHKHQSKEHNFFTAPSTHRGSSSETWQREHDEHRGGMRIVDKYGKPRYICGTPIYSSSGAIIGSTGYTGCTTNIVASTYPSAIISNGYITYPSGTLYQDGVTGRWQSCPYPLVFDTRTNRATCEPPVAAAPAEATYQPARPPAPEHTLRSDSNLRSDKNMY